MINFDKKIWDLRMEIIDEIRKIILANNMEVHIPYFYDEIDSDVESLIEDGYNVQQGSCWDNLSVEIKNDYSNTIYLVSVYLEKNGNVMAVTNENNIIYVSDIDLCSLSRIYEKLAKQTGL